MCISIYSCHTVNSHDYPEYSYGRVAMVKALINAGAKADICDNYGRTPLYRAKDLNHPMVRSPCS
jgi:ankyrin repeat protein